MHVQSCFFPKVYKNPYTGDFGVGKCCKCPACTNNRAYNWVKRLDMEAACHKYVLFVTLTFDEQHVAQIVRLPFDKYQITDNKDFFIPKYIDYETGEYFDFTEFALQKKDISYLKESRVINRLDKRDFQLFIKRLRYFFNQTDKGALLRYYLCGELGPSTFRPHGHLLLFFDSEKCAEQITSLLHKAWSSDGKLFGNVYDPHFVTGSAAQYCASYINSLASLPRCYLHKGLRPFTLFSKRPAIGSLFPNVKEVREIFDRGDIKFRRFCESSRTFKDEFFWHSFSARLYPRLQRFGSLSHDDRVALYRLIQDEDITLSSRELARRIKTRWIDNPSDTFFSRYFREIAFKKKKVCRFLHRSPDLSSYYNLPFFPKDVNLERPFEILKGDFVKVYCENSLIRFCSTIKRVAHQSQIFGVSIPFYVSKIENYYDSLSYHRLVCDYQFQDEYFRSHPKWHYIYFDKVFYDKVTTKDFFSLPVTTQENLRNIFSPGAFKLKTIFDARSNPIDVIDIPPLDSLPEFMDMKITHLKISHDMTKQKENNDYALAHKDKFNNIIHYQNF